MDPLLDANAALTTYEQASLAETHRKLVEAVDRQGEVFAELLHAPKAER